VDIWEKVVKKLRIQFLRPCDLGDPWYRLGVLGARQEAHKKDKKQIKESTECCVWIRGIGVGGGKVVE